MSLYRAFKKFTEYHIRSGPQITVRRLEEREIQQTLQDTSGKRALQEIH